MSEPATSPSDHDLVARIRAGDEAGLSGLYDRYADRLFSLAVAITRDDAEAEEAVSDAFLHLWQSADHDPDRGSVGVYLVMLTRSRALDRLRARRRRDAREERGAQQSPDGAAIPISSMGPAPDVSAERGLLREQISAAMDGLSGKQRHVIDLAFFGGMTHREIAEHLSEPLGTVKTRLRDGMRKLQELFPATARSS